MITRTVLASTLVLSAAALACSSSTKTPNEPPGAATPASPASSHTETGGPANPGAPAMGSVVTPDGGKH